MLIASTADILFFRIYFEKSANYISGGSKVIKRINTLLPQALIVIVLLNPKDRAYSWYQHQKAHKDELALKYSFEEVLTGKDPKLESLRNHCLDPGLYLKHIKNVHNAVSFDKIIIVDGDMLKTHPAIVMNEFVDKIRKKFLKKLGYRRSKLHTNEKFLNSITDFNYEKEIYLDAAKGKFCKKSISPGNSDFSMHHCLGSGKGRKYPRMSDKAWSYLEHFYKEPNAELAEYLRLNNFDVPAWA